VTSIERTAYPQFRRLTSARVLHVSFTPAEDEVAWARERAETPEALLALLVDLKCFTAWGWPRKLSLAMGGADG
jgi:Domain of unknown function (DUF4158)